MAGTKYHTVPNSTKPERLEVIEDEVKGLESMIDSRTRKLWEEIVKLRTEVRELRDRTTNTKEVRG